MGHWDFGKSTRWGICFGFREELGRGCGIGISGRARDGLLGWDHGKSSWWIFGLGFLEELGMGLDFGKSSWVGGSGFWEELDVCHHSSVICPAPLTPFPHYLMIFPDYSFCLDHFGCFQNPK